MIHSFEWLDRIILLRINSFHTLLLDSVMWGLSESWHTYLFVLVVAFSFYKKFNLKKAVELVLGVAIVIACTDMSSNLVKHAVKRYRPTHNLEIKDQINIVNDYKGGQYGFISSHASNGFGITTFLFFCIHWLNKKVKLLLFIYPIMIGYSRMYLGVHYPSDIFFGAIDGLIFGSLIYLVFNKYFLKLDEKT